MISIGLEGARQTIRELEAYNDRIVEAVVVTINDAAQEVYNESQRAVPVDTGNLRSSGRIEPAEADDEHEEGPRAFISYGGTAADYALEVHETHPTQSKYLEAPARNYAARFLDDLGLAIKDASRG